MAQDRLTEGGRSIVWKAVMDSLNAHRRDGALARGLFIKFERWTGGFGDHWEPGMPDEPSLITDADIQKLIADIAADVCRRVEEALDCIDPREPAKPPSAADKAKQRWGAWGAGDVVEGRVASVDVKAGIVAQAEQEAELEAGMAESLERSKLAAQGRLPNGQPMDPRKLDPSAPYAKVAMTHPKDHRFDRKLEAGCSPRMREEMEKDEGDGEDAAY